MEPRTPSFHSPDRTVVHRSEKHLRVSRWRVLERGHDHAWDCCAQATIPSRFHSLRCKHICVVQWRGSPPGCVDAASMRSGTNSTGESCEYTTRRDVNGRFRARTAQLPIALSCSSHADAIDHACRLHGRVHKGQVKARENRSPAPKKGVVFEKIPCPAPPPVHLTAVVAANYFAISTRPALAGQLIPVLWPNICDMPDLRYPSVRPTPASWLRRRN